MHLSIYLSICAPIITHNQPTEDIWNKRKRPCMLKIKRINLVYLKFLADQNILYYHTIQPLAVWWIRNRCAENNRLGRDTAAFFRNGKRVNIYGRISMRIIRWWMDRSAGRDDEITLLLVFSRRAMEREIKITESLSFIIISLSSSQTRISPAVRPYACDEMLHIPGYSIA